MDDENYKIEWYYDVLFVVFLIVLFIGFPIGFGLVCYFLAK